MLSEMVRALAAACTTAGKRDCTPSYHPHQGSHCLTCSSSGEPSRLRLLLTMALARSSSSLTALAASASLRARTWANLGEEAAWREVGG